MYENKIITFEEGWKTIELHLNKLYKILNKLYNNEHITKEESFTKKEYSETYTYN